MTLDLRIYYGCIQEGEESIAGLVIQAPEDLVNLEEAQLQNIYR